jgi:urocanate hydratase
MMLDWDVLNGIARRCWSGNQYAYDTAKLAMQETNGLHITLPYRACDSVIDSLNFD